MKQQFLIITTIELRGFHVPVVIWPDGRTSFSYAVNENEVIFTEGHGMGSGDAWISVSSSLPSTCAPRPCLPTGEINTMEDYASIYFKDKIILGVFRRS
jgi:hypothetical protein